MAHIYVIKCLVSGKSYVGSSAVVEKRKKQHITALESGNHWNPNLQRSWKKYGSESFAFEIIEECSDSDRWERENHWMSELSTLAPNGFNLQDAFNAQLTQEKLENIRKSTRTPEIRKQRSEFHKSLWSNPDFKQKMKDQMKEKWSDSEYRSMMAHACSGTYTQERIESMSSKMLDKWRDEDFKEKQSLSWDEERRAQTSERMKGMWKDEEYRKSQNDSRKNKRAERQARPLTPEEEEAQKEKKRIRSEKLRAAWERNPERRKKQSEVMKQGQAKKALESSLKARRKKKDELVHE